MPIVENPHWSCLAARLKDMPAVTNLSEDDHDRWLREVQRSITMDDLSLWAKGVTQRAMAEFAAGDAVAAMDEADMRTLYGTLAEPLIEMRNRQRR